jgi:CMP-N,N'-diacetyllegionaminic acid synthase
MSIGDHRVLAVVPARGGSKGIPKKNLAIVGDRSLIARAADTARECPSIDAAVISTDDVDMAEEGRRYGLLCPSLRPTDLADDEAKSIDVWRHAWLEAEQVLGQRFEISVLLEPTSPLRTTADIEEVLAVLTSGRHRAAATVSPTPAHYTPHKTLVVNDSGHLQSLLPPEMSPTIRQLIPSQFHRNGICYAVWRSTLFEHHTIVEEECAAVVIERPVVNIDEPFEIELAEWLLSREQSRE